MFEPSHIVVKPFKGLKTLKVSVKLIWLLSIPIVANFALKSMRTFLLTLEQKLTTDVPCRSKKISYFGRQKGNL